MTSVRRTWHLRYEVPGTFGDSSWNDGNLHGFTTAKSKGNLGGSPGANSKCSAEFPGSWLCTEADYDLANTTIGPPVGGAWVDLPRNTDGTCRFYGCYYGNTTSAVWSYGGQQTGNSGQSGAVLTVAGDYTYAGCDRVLPLACCARR